MKLLLDEHIWPGVVGLVKKLTPAEEIASIHQYAHGLLINRTDDEVLAEASRGHWTLVTFDLNTIPPLLGEMAIAGADHSGVIFVSSKSFAQNDHTRLAQALAHLLASESAADWTNRIMFLSRKASKET